MYSVSVLFSTSSILNVPSDPDKPDWSLTEAVTSVFQQCGILICVDSDEPVQPPFKLRNYE